MGKGVQFPLDVRKVWRCLVEKGDCKGLVFRAQQVVIRHRWQELVKPTWSTADVEGGRRQDRHDERRDEQLAGATHG
eukprot:2096521-Prymnesium_polylepis.1